MDLNEIKEIIEIMKSSGLTEFEIEEKGLRLRICRNTNGNGNGSLAVVQAAPTYPGAVPAILSPQSDPASQSSEPEAGEEEEDFHLIKSPMVGTFYRSPSPESPPFINEGDTVDRETTVCILEAMKVMNEIPADVSGEIVQIYLQNGAAVEYGQPLFKVKKT